MKTRKVKNINELKTTSALKYRIIQNKLISYECAECDIVETWNDKPLSLHLDHIDGNNKNNSLSNLRFLCPNCHSQTDTYCDRNNSFFKYTKIHVSEEQILNILSESSKPINAIQKLGWHAGYHSYTKIYELAELHNIEHMKKNSNRKKDYLINVTDSELLNVLKKNKNNKSKTARELKCSRQLIDRRLAKIILNNKD